jgi:surface antigen
MLTNLGSRELRVNFAAYDEDGEFLGASTIRLAAQATRTLETGEVLPESGTLKVEAKEHLWVGAIFRTRDGTKAEVLPALGDPSRQLDFPALLPGDLSGKTITLLNPDAASASLELIALDQTGAELSRTLLPSLPPMASHTFAVQDLFSADILQQLATVRVISDRRLVGLQLVDPPDGDLVGLPALTITSREWSFPIATRGEAGELWTAVGLFNPGEVATSVTVEAFDAAHHSLGIIDSLTLLPGAAHFVLTANQQGLIPEEAAFLKVTSDQPITGYEVVGVVNGKGLAAALGIRGEDQTAAGLEIAGSKDGSVLNAYPMVRMGDGSVKSIAWSLGSGEWRETHQAGPEIKSLRKSETISALADSNCGGISSPGNPFDCCPNGGNCTWWAWHMAKSKWGVDFPARGHAKTWAAAARRYDDYLVTSTPAVNTIAVNTTQAADGVVYGHVAWVEEVAGGKVKVSEMNCCSNCSFGPRYKWYPISYFDGGFIHYKPFTPPLDSIGSNQSYACFDCINNGKYHTGVDIYNPTLGYWGFNTPVKAIRAGEIVLIRRIANKSENSNGDPFNKSAWCDGSTTYFNEISPLNAGFGNVIILKHSDGKYSLYGHLDCIDKEIVERFLRKNGKTPFVSSGERLGIMGNSYKTPESEGGYHARRYCRQDRLPPGYDCSKAITAGLCTRCDNNGFRPHLHFEMKSRGKLGNPLEYSGSRTDRYFGYTPDHPDYYGYFNPFPPAITNINPTSGVAGTPVTINGANFGGTKGTSIVRFGTKIASVTSWNDTKIIAIAPAGSGTVNVTVTTSATQSNGVPFTYTTAPTNVQVTAPTSGQTVSGTFTFKATAQDNSGTVQKMEFYVDSDTTPACTDSMAKPSGSTFQCNWNTASKPNGSHTVRAKAYDPSGNSAFSPPVSFIINNVVTTPPTNVQVTSPVSGQTISGTFTLRGTAQDDSGTIQKMEFYIDSDTSPACSDTTPKASGSTFQCNWNTASKPNGSHTVRAKAYDPSGNSAFSPPVSFIINNVVTTPPTNVQVTSPVSGQTISGTFTLRGTAQDDSGTIQKMEFYIDSDTSPACSDTTPKASGSTFQCNWNTASKPNGSHTVRAKAYDPSGNSAFSPPVSFIINNVVTTPPTNVQVTSPVSGQTISGTFTLRGTAQDDSGTIQKMEFYIDSDTSPACSDTTPKASGSTFQCNWNTASKPNGSHTVRAKAYDPSGNSAFSPPVSFIINNVVTTPPTNVQVTSPVSGQTISGTFTLRGTAQDDSGTIQKMEFYIDSDTSPACSDTTPKASGSTFQCNWNTASKPNGSHTVRAKAYDPSGNSAFSPPVSFIINNSTTPTNRLLNPSFESGSAYWVQYSSTGYNIITNSTAARARTGSWYAWFGSSNNISEYIYQDVTIPANATVANVEFWYQVATDETSTSTCYDKLVVEVRRPSDNALLRTLTMLCNYHKTNIWTRSGPFSVLDFRGQTIRLRFYCTTDGSLPTSFFVDDVALIADGN